MKCGSVDGELSKRIQKEMLGPETNMQSCHGGKFIIYIQKRDADLACYDEHSALKLFVNIHLAPTLIRLLL